jgi:fructoselysine transporter
VALCGWLYIYLTIGLLFIAMGAVTLVAGLVVFLIWAKRRGEWPFAR